MKKLLLFTLLLLGGCFATAHPMYLPDGSAGYRISCGDYVNTTADCLQKAGDLCGTNGYQIYDQNGHLKPDDAQNQSVIATINNSAAKHDKTTADTPKSMFIKCKTNDAPTRLTPAPTPQVDNKPIPLENTMPTLTAPSTPKAAAKK